MSDHFVVVVWSVVTLVVLPAFWVLKEIVA